MLYGSELSNARIDEKSMESDIEGRRKIFARDSPLDSDWERRVQDIGSVLRSVK